MNFSHEFWFQIAVYVITGMIAIIRVSMIVGELKGNMATKEQLNEKVKERNHAIDRVYERFDEFKRETAEHFVRKDMCAQMHISSKDELKRIDDEYKAFRHEIRNAIQHLADKMDEVKEYMRNGKPKM